MADISAIKLPNGTTYNLKDTTARNAANSAVPNTRTVNGKALSSDISLGAGDVGAYTKKETDTKINAAVASTYKYKGSVTADKLPTSGQVVGDVYNITNDSSYGKAGMNVAWNGTTWDALGSNVDLSNYVTTSDSRLSNARPASDVYAWAKAAKKPSYSASEIGGLGSLATKNSLSAGDVGALPTSGGTMTGDIAFAATGTTGTSNKISFSGSTDGAQIYYNVPSSDQGNLIFNMTDDTNAYIQFAQNGTVHSYISPADGTYHGNISGSAGSVAWGNVSDKPSTYPPSSHTHTKAQVGLGNVANLDQSKAIKSITRNGTTFTATALDGTTTTFTQQDNNTTYGIATSSADGLMSKSDKAKLDGIDPSAITTNAANIKKNADAISAETTRAKAAEKANADTISAEVTRAKKAEEANTQLTNDLKTGLTSGTVKVAKATVADSASSLGKVSTYQTEIPDNGGRRKYLLMYDITDWISAKSNASTRAFDGYFFSRRSGGYVGTNYTGNLSIVASWNGVNSDGSPIKSDNGVSLRLRTTSSTYVPRILHQKSNDKYYLSLMTGGSGRDLILFGIFQGTFIGTWINNEGANLSNGTLPSDYEEYSDGFYIIPYERAVCDKNGKDITEYLVAAAYADGAFTFTRGNGDKTVLTIPDTVSKIINDHIANKSNPHGVTKAQVGLGSVANLDQSKAIKSITRSGTTFTATALDGTTTTFTQQDNNTTYSVATSSADGLMSKSDKAKLDGIGTGSNVKSVNGKTGAVTLAKGDVGLGSVANLDQSKAIKSITRSGTTFTATALDGTTTTFTQQDNNTTYGLASQSSNGLMSAADKKAVDREFFRMLPKGGTVIPNGANLNSTAYLKVGNYYQSANVNTTNMTNIPFKAAFMMYVLSPLSEGYDNESTAQWVYRLRIFVEYTGNNIFVQNVYSGNTAGSFTYGPWVKMTNSNDLGAVSKIINDHIANKSNPHSVTKAQVGLGNVDNTADSAKSVKYATSAGSANSVAWGNVSGRPSSLPANGGNSSTVNGHTVNADVPSGAKFTDTNTWRGITDSYSGTDSGISLSQKGGNALYNALVNGYASSAGSADTVDGFHEYSFLRYRDKTSTEGTDTLWSQIGIREYDGARPEGITDGYNWGSVVSLPTGGPRFDLWYNHQTSSNGDGLRYRTGWGNDKKAWATILDSVNYNKFAPTKTGTGASGTWGINVTGNAGTVNGHTVNANVPSGAKFTDTTYGVATQSANGLMSAADKKKLDSYTTGSAGSAGGAVEVTLAAASWSSSTTEINGNNYYTYSVSVANIGNPHPQIFCSGGNSIIPSATQESEFNHIRYALVDTAKSTVTFYSIEKPSVAINVVIKDYLESSIVSGTASVTIATSDWSSTTSTVNGRAFYTAKKTLSSVSSNYPTIICGTADTLPSDAEQTAFNCINYAAADTSTKTVTFYAVQKPASAVVAIVI